MDNKKVYEGWLFKVTVQKSCTSRSSDALEKEKIHLDILYWEKVF